MSPPRQFYYGYGGYDGDYDWFDGLDTDTDRPHGRLLLRAMYSNWSSVNDSESYQYLADAYNEYLRKEAERSILPPPSHL